jgi:hypothetical protein
MYREAIEAHPDGAFIAFQFTCPVRLWRRFSYAESWPSLRKALRTVPSRHRHAYEIVRYGVPCKPYIDFDMEQPPPEWTEQRVVATLEPLVLKVFRDDYGIVLSPESMAWSTGSRPGKLSLHLVVSTHEPQFLFRTNKAGEPGSAYSLAFRLRHHLAIVAPELVECVDKAVYTRDREMRLVGSTKRERPEYPLKALDPTKPYADHCITWLDSDQTQVRTSLRAFLANPYNHTHRVLHR